MYVRNKSKTTPVVINGHLYWDEDFFSVTANYKVPVDSPAWFQWLGNPDHKTFYFENVVCDFTARQEPREENYYWYAYKKANGRTFKVYLGRYDKITLGRLREAAEKLYQKI